MANNNNEGEQRWVALLAVFLAVAILPPNITAFRGTVLGYVVQIVAVVGVVISVIALVKSAHKG